MGKLYSQYVSGIQFTAGTTVGSTMGISGLNAIIDRLNSVTTTDNHILGSLISGTSTIITAGSIIMSSGAFVLETRTSDPGAIATGRMWIRSDL